MVARSGGGLDESIITLNSGGGLGRSEAKPLVEGVAGAEELSTCRDEGSEGRRRRRRGKNNQPVDRKKKIISGREQGAAEEGRWQSAMTAGGKQHCQSIKPKITTFYMKISALIKRPLNNKLLSVGLVGGLN